MNYLPSLASIIPTIKMECCQYIGTKDHRISKIKKCITDLSAVQFLSITDLDYSELIAYLIELFLEALGQTKM